MVVEMSRINRMAAAAFLASVWLTSPLAVGVAAADRSANESASDSTDSKSTGGAASRGETAPPVRVIADPDASEAEPFIAVDPPETHVVEIDQPLPKPLPDVDAIDETMPGKPAVGVEEGLPEAQPAAGIEEALPEAQPGAEAEEAVTGDVVAEVLSVDTVEEALPEPQPGDAVEDAAPESGAESTGPATEDAGGDGTPELDPNAEAPTEDQQSVDGAGGRGGGLTPLPFWRTGVENPPTDGDPQPVALESTGVDAGVAVPEPLSPDIDTDQPVYYFGGLTDPGDPPVLTAGGTGQLPAGTPQTDGGSGILTEALENGKITWGLAIAIEQVLDAMGAWISGLPAGPLQDLLAGGLLLVRNALFGSVESVKSTRPDSGQLIDGDDDSGESDADSGEWDSVGEDYDIDDTGDSGDSVSDESDMDDLIEELTGLGESDAQVAAGDRGLTVRVVARDGEYFAVTKDYRTDRVNFEIVDGVVVKVSIG